VREHRALLTSADIPLHDCELFDCEQTALLKAYSGILGVILTSDEVWDYFFKAVQRPSLLPKDSAEFQAWYNALPQKQPMDSESYKAWYKAYEKTTPHLQSKDSEAYKAWYKAYEKTTPPMQPKNSDAFREWLQRVREHATQRSVDAHDWFKSKPPTADRDAGVKGVVV